MNVHTFILLFVAFIDIHVIFASKKKFTTRKINNENYTICNTTECKKAALDIVNSLNRSIDPCDNFYQFACGGWVKNHPVNSSHSQIDTFTILNDRAKQQIREILEDNPKKTDTLALGKARRIYQLCMNIDEHQSSITFLNKVLDRIGGWPLLMTAEEWQIKQNYTWQQYSDNLQEHVIHNGLYRIIVGVDIKNNSKNVITIWEPTIKYLGDSSTYMSYIDQVAQMLMTDRSTICLGSATRAQDIQDIVNFERQLHQLGLSPEDNSNIDKVYNARTIEQLQQEYDAKNPIKSQINWYDTFKKMFERIGITIQPSEKLIVLAYEYLMRLGSLLDQTPTRTIVNYMQWTFVRDWISYAGSPNKSSCVEMSEKNKGLQQDSERWKHCIQVKNLQSAISHEYAKRNVPDGKKEDVKIMFANIKNAVRKQILASTWLDNDMKTVSLDKLDNMNSYVSTPDWYNAKAIDKYYQDLTVVDGYLENSINLFKFETSKMFLLLRQPVDRKQWDIEPTEADAYNALHINSFFITAAVMQEPVHEKNRPIFMDYGSLGLVIGHEINHGFDNHGRHYDKTGNFIQWWTKETIHRYEQLTKCFVDQYSRYKWPGLETSKKDVYVDGQLALGENIAESGGIAAAFSAYKDIKLNMSEMQLPGLENYTNDQIFFMNYARMFCDNATPEKSELLRSNEHLRGETRVIGSLSNLPEFAMAYNCPTEKKMNPNKRCILWQ